MGWITGLKIVGGDFWSIINEFESRHRMERFLRYFISKIEPKKDKRKNAGYGP